MGRKVPKKTPAHERTVDMFSTRDRAPGVAYVPFEHPRRLLTTKPGSTLTAHEVNGAIVRIAPRADDSDDVIESLRNLLNEWGAARVFVLPRPREKVLPEKKVTAMMKTRSLRQVVEVLIAESAFDDKEALGALAEELMVSEKL